MSSDSPARPDARRAPRPAKGREPFGRGARVESRAANGPCRLGGHTTALECLDQKCGVPYVGRRGVRRLEGRRVGARVFGGGRGRRGRRGRAWVARRAVRRLEREVGPGRRGRRAVHDAAEPRRGRDAGRATVLTCLLAAAVQAAHRARGAAAARRRRRRHARPQRRREQRGRQQQSRQTLREPSRHRPQEITPRRLFTASPRPLRTEADPAGSSGLRAEDWVKRQGSFFHSALGAQSSPLRTCRAG